MLLDTRKRGLVNQTTMAVCSNGAIWTPFLESDYTARTVALSALALEVLKSMLPTWEVQSTRME